MKFRITVSAVILAALGIFLVAGEMSGFVFSQTRVLAQHAKKKTCAAWRSLGGFLPDPHSFKAMLAQH